MLVVDARDCGRLRLFADAAVFDRDRDLVATISAVAGFVSDPEFSKILPIEQLNSHYIWKCIWKTNTTYPCSPKWHFSNFCTSLVLSKMSIRVRWSFVVSIVVRQFPVRERHLRRPYWHNHVDLIVLAV